MKKEQFKDLIQVIYYLHKLLDVDVPTVVGLLSLKGLVVDEDSLLGLSIPEIQESLSNEQISLEAVTLSIIALGKELGLELIPWQLKIESFFMGKTVTKDQGIKLVDLLRRSNWPGVSGDERDAFLDALKISYGYDQEECIVAILNVLRHHKAMCAILNAEGKAISEQYLTIIRKVANGEEVTVGQYALFPLEAVPLVMEACVALSEMLETASEAGRIKVKEILGCLLK